MKVHIKNTFSSWIRPYCDIPLASTFWFCIKLGSWLRLSITTWQYWPHTWQEQGALVYQWIGRTRKQNHHWQILLRSPRKAWYSSSGRILQVVNAKASFMPLTKPCGRSLNLSISTEQYTRMPNSRIFSTIQVLLPYLSKVATGKTQGQGCHTDSAKSRKLHHHVLSFWLAISWIWLSRSRTG